MTYDVIAFQVHEDVRGRLLPVELDEAPFPVRRVFTVQAPPGGSTRGDHTTTCLEMIVLLSGSLRLEVGPSPDLTAMFELDRPGSAVAVGEGDYVRYTLESFDSAILVLASEPYDGGR